MMKLKNTHALMILAVLVGIASNLGLIGARSYLLSRADVVYTVYGSIVAGLAFVFFLQSFQNIRIKFARFAVLSSVGLALLLLFLAFGMQDGTPKALAWFFAAYFGFDLMHWIVNELARRHLPPATASAYFSYMSAYFEGGTLVVIVLGRVFGGVLSPEQSLVFIAGVVFLSVIFILKYFVPVPNFEIRYSTASSNEETGSKPAVVSSLRLLLLITILFAMIEVSIDYSVSLALKEALGTYDKIRMITENYFFLSCVLIIFFSNLMGWLIRQKRISPIQLMRLNALILAIAALLCVVFQSFYFFIAAEILRRVAEYTLYGPANQMVLASLPKTIRIHMTARQNLYFYSFVPLVMVAVFSLTSKLPLASESLVISLLILSSAVAVYGLLTPFGKQINAAMYAFANSVDKSVAVIAVHMLSYLKPKDFTARMTALLNQEPKKLLRKTIILGLGYSHEEDSVDVITQQFFTEKEEIQIATLDALRISRRFRASKFLVDVLENKVTSKTQRVRLNAMSVIGGMFGSVAIPFLLKGLEDDDPRVIANALEVLGMFQEPELIPYFKRFSDSIVPRVGVNALMALSKLRSCRDLYRQGLNDMLSSEDHSRLAAALYAVGKLQDSRFRERVLKVFHQAINGQDTQLANPLSWAMIRIGEEKGYGLAAEIILFQKNQIDTDAFLHYFSQHTQEVRFEIVKQFVSRHPGDREAILVFGRRLKDSVFAFYEELEYLNLCFESHLPNPPPTQ